MILNDANIRVLSHGYDGTFKKAYEEEPNEYEAFTYEIAGSGSEMRFGWMTNVPTMREWIGPRVAVNVNEESYILPTRKWEQTLDVKREDIEDNNLGTYDGMFEMAGQAAKRHKNTLANETLVAGGTELCFDGQPYFHASHPIDTTDASKGTYSNTDTLALTQDNFFTIRAKMRSYKNTEGRPLYTKPDTLIVHPDQEQEALEIVVAKTVPTSGGGNVSKDLAKVVVIDDITSGTWYLADGSRAIKPIVIPVRRKLETKLLNSMEFVMQEDVIRWMASARYSAGYTLPFLCHRSVSP